MTNTSQLDRLADDMVRLFDYDPDTGLFIRKTSRSFPNPRNNYKAGEIAGWEHPQGYVGITIRSKSHLAHRLAWLWVNCEWPIFPKECIDHINRDKADNRIDNLRMVSQSENMANSRARAGYKGVSRYRLGRGGYRARITKDRKEIHIGLFDTKEAAALAYNEAAVELFGDCALINTLEE